MTKPTDVRIVEAHSHREKFAYRTPMKFGGRTVQDATVQRVFLTVENRSGKKPTVGVGEMTMGTAWAWPSKKLSPEQVSRVVLGLIDRLIKRVSEIDLIAHPIDLGLRLIEEAKSSAAQLAEQMALPEAIPDLAILLACSRSTRPSTMPSEGSTASVPSRFFRKSFSRVIYRDGSVRNMPASAWNNKYYRSQKRPFLCTTWSVRLTPSHQANSRTALTTACPRRSMNGSRQKG